MTITNLAASLVKAQAEMGGAKKDSANPFFKSRYADLSSVDAAIGPVAAKYGLAYLQVSHERENAAAIETIIVHESGESYACGVVAVPVSKADAQGFGSAMTYARRYSLSAAFGVCPEDDDGNAATKAAPKSAGALKEAGKMPAKEFVDHCTAMSDAVDLGMDALELASAKAAAAAKSYGDKEALASLKTKYEQALAMIVVKP